MSSATTPAWFLSKRPHGPLSDELTLKEVPAPSGDVKDGHVRVELNFISVDPYLRGRLNTLPLDQPMVSGVSGTVKASKSDKFKEGDKVVYYGPWIKLQDVNTANKEQQLQLVPDAEHQSNSLGVLGMPGATAYFGLKYAASFKKGDRVIVTGAAGAVGSTVGQLAKLWGASKVIGVAGGPEKCALLTEKFGFDGAIDYKKFDTQAKVSAELKRLNPEGFDVFFENTGGHVSDAIYGGGSEAAGIGNSDSSKSGGNLRKHARVALCGSISNYNDKEKSKIPNPFLDCIYTSVRIQGFVVFDYLDKWAEFLGEAPQLVKSGQLKYEETVREGFENTFEAFQGLFKGTNTGKMIVKV